jgi:hypothetical protein
VAAPVSADDATDAKQLVERAKLTIDSFAADKVMGKPVKDLIKTAKGAGTWNGPAFYTMGEASFGLQEAYYGKKELSPTDILVRRTVTNPGAAPLLNEIRKLASGK